MSVPQLTRKSSKEKLWEHADELGCTMPSPADKSRQYEAWTKDSNIGGRLSRYMNQGQIQVYN